MAGGRVAPDDPDDAIVDGVLVWSTVVSDRHRLRDRMRELRIAPWADAAGEGAALRMAAARAALGRLVAATTPAAAGPPPDLVVTAGGVWSSVPAPAVALALVDVLRRPGAASSRSTTPGCSARWARSPIPGSAWRSWPTSSTTCWPRWAAS